MSRSQRSSLADFTRRKSLAYFSESREERLVANEPRLFAAIVTLAGLELHDHLLSQNG